LSAPSSAATRRWSSAKPSRDASSICSAAKGEVVSDRLALRDAFVEPLAAYRREAWEEVRRSRWLLRDRAR